MRLAACAGLLLLTIVFLGCGDGGSGGATASAGAAPPAPGGPPAGPPAPGSDAPPGSPSPDAPAPETPPPAETPPATLPGDTPPDAPQQPGGSSDGGGSTEGGQPGGGQFDGGQPGGEDPNANPDGTPRRPPPPRTLRDQAYAAFKSGNDLMGYKLLNAHFAVVPAAKNELSQKMAWVPGLMKPGIAPRIAIGVFYEKIPLNFKGNPMPIGSTELTTAVDSLQQAEASDTRIGGTGRKKKFGRGVRGGSLDMSEKSKGDATASQPAPQQVAYYLGEFGEMFHEALLDRMENGDYGPVLQDLMRQASRPIQRGRNAGQDGQSVAGGSGDGQPGDDSAGGSGGGRGSRGGGSALAGAGSLPGLDDGAENKPRRFSSKASDKEAANLSHIKQLSPCILWLGMAEDREDLTKRAEAANCDILAVFQIILREARTGSLINNTTTLKIQNLRSAKPLPNYSPEPLINLTVETWRQKEEKGVDPVEREVIKAIEALDHALKPVPLPEAVTAERAKKRIADLVAQKPEDPLPVIVEARFYAAKGLMTDAEYIETAKALVGDAGFEKLKARAKEGE